jgi:hypothetical protein
MADMDDDAARLAIAQGLMVEITIRLEDLAERAARLQRSRTSDLALGEDAHAVKDMIAAHIRLLPVRLPRARART